ncbi:MAG: ribosomal protein S18-alanine N-acetyltransferase [Candidatus Palauibacterales bacterium]|nr:ribosomal protein S18-alanine N-acetyltransferase [Candidatus Palauibacterales bacterium]MDP2530313.1 ribosomal protein S18-alanine N-acetyltransferase [Candidatus Palauibacterales bacterium]MDP2583098.1 ribosomal protein S18-alanine N-acetyltransferase [Candidatus Palauibacterales bacterium]
MAFEAEAGAALLIREGRREDLPAVVAIERASFPTPWSERAFRSLFARPDAVLLVAELEGRVVGHAAAWFLGDRGELADLAVDPSVRRRGIGRRLLGEVVGVAAERAAVELYLSVRVSNVAARRLYSAAGFRVVGRRRAYYRVPREDALVLGLEIPRPAPAVDDHEIR